MKKLKYLFFLCVFLLTGCSDYRELSDLSIVSSIGIDKKEDSYIIYTQILNSKQQTDSQSESTSPQIVVYKSEGKTLHEAFRNTILESPKKLYVGHVETLIVSEKIAKEDITMIFDFLLRDPEVNADFTVFLAEDDSVSDIMQTMTPIDNIPAENVSSSMEITAKLLGAVDDITFDKFSSYILQQGIDAVIPLISVKETKTEEENINPSKRLMIDKKMGIFDGDKYLTTLSDDASFGYNLINNNFESSVVSFKCSNNSYASIEIIDNKTKLSYDTKKEMVKIEAVIEGSLSEIDCDIDVSDKNGIEKIESKIEKHIKEIINATLDEAIEYNESDFLGIGQNIFQNENKYYKKNKNNIESLIKNMKKDINVKVTLSQKGLIKEGNDKY